MEKIMINLNGEQHKIGTILRQPLHKWLAVCARGYSHVDGETELVFQDKSCAESWLHLVATRCQMRNARINRTGANS